MNFFLRANLFLLIFILLWSFPILHSQWFIQNSCASTVHLSQTGQTKCYDTAGTEIPCAGTGQDGELRVGVPSPEPRFTANGDCVTDNVTGLIWAKNVNLPGGTRTWQGALNYVAALNSSGSLCGQTDWRLPNRKELQSPMDLSHSAPALPSEHPFTNVLDGIYWSSSTSVYPAGYAWIVGIYDGSMGFDNKISRSYYVWPVRGEENPQDGTIQLPETGQTISYATGDDGDLERGVTWPSPRFIDPGNGEVTDNLTGLVWTKDANLMASRDPFFDADGKVFWQRALDYVKKLNSENYLGYSVWRLPNVMELESLVDISKSSPAMSAGHPFSNIQGSIVQNGFYWSSSNNAFNTDAAWIVDVYFGYVNRGDKGDYSYYVWPVRGGQVDWVDSDGDGLSDSEEIRLKSDPLNAGSLPPVRIVGGNYYISLHTAHAEATAGAVIQAQVVPFPEFLNIDKVMTIKGGYDGGYSSVTGYTTVQEVTIGTGALTVDRLMIQ